MRRSLRIVLTILALSLSAASFGKSKLGYIVVTDHIKAKEWRSGDVSNALQRIIDENPNCTIFFPDGEYKISNPILTSANPTESVSLLLSDYAIIRANESWTHDEAMIRLGGKGKSNDITAVCSRYSLEGGIIDCNGVAKAISIDGGRETVVRNCTIKRTLLGLHIKRGINSGSSDCDIVGVNIVGCSAESSVGVLIEGYDNTLTNMRIGGVHTGVIIKSGANCLRNIHPLFFGKNTKYASSCGFVDECGNNFYDFCYSDEFATAFRITKGRHSVYSNCYAYWYSHRGEKHTVFKSDGEFNAFVTNLDVGFSLRNNVKYNKVLECGVEGGKGVFDNIHFHRPELANDSTHEAYVK
ncbi:MAG: hypothetical protein J6V21_03415 [Alistipes sp.]|nr:hypothetical protein [Alistipes sp.]